MEDVDQYGSRKDGGDTHGGHDISLSRFAKEADCLFVARNSNLRGTEIIVAQAAYTAAEFDAFGRSKEASVRDDPWSKTEYITSLRRLHELTPQRAWFSHDATVWRPHEAVNESR
jgi:hypothetical protein